MPRRVSFLDADFSSQWDKAYADLPAGKQTQVDQVVLALLKQDPTPGMRVKPVLPEKYHHEARINSGDRAIYRVGDGICFFVDIVPHDLIDKYGRKPKLRG